MDSGKSWTEYFRIISPMLLTVLIFMAGQIQTNQKEIKDELLDINSKLFRHLTNDEIHCPRSIMITKDEVNLLTKMRDRQIQDIRDVIRDNFEQMRIEIRNPKVYVK
jgi:hypothetical protein